MKIILNNSIVFAIVVATLIGCQSSESENTETGNAPFKAAQVVENYADIVYANYQDSLKTAQALQQAVNQLVAAPSESTLAAAKEAWLQARIPYGQTEVYRFYNGPIDNEENGPEGLLNAWPMDEAYVDYVEGGEMVEVVETEVVEIAEGAESVMDTSSGVGIINNVAAYPEISHELLIELNEQNGEANISTGYHAIEFLLWGQDLNEAGPGTRPFTDYTTAANAERRGAYLQAVTSLLIEHLQGLVDEWSPGQTDNYRSQFLKQTTSKSIHSILIGMIELSGHELSGERMMVAYETQAQEDEHSCFSDNTHVDIIENARGIQNVYLGRYNRTNGDEVAGASVFDLLAQQDGELSQVIAKQLEQSLAAAQSISVPFDNSIMGSDETEGRKQVKETIELLRNQAETLQEASVLLGVKISR